ncbi:MAG: hypothetical protein IPP97_05135 [Candidatus Obscuribacter sp.]|jgi:hypothetical protein|nr:hypothetical protein [Candidatus Obscuribacter sp.]MBP6348126.1 hypothetical protein [Candidatus Obscuribacter sp.]MBP6591531.1 hypothetical protein [Candidatus Obscuribacter sp.]MBP7575320.1 hypothetical protein [Candidatus Obscuribacter sp.]
MAKPRRTWRTKLDDLIESELAKAGFEPFSGTEHFFPISDEVLGIIHISNQTSIYGKVALIKTDYGIIHYQLGLLWRQMADYSRWYCQETLASSVSDFDIWIPQCELSETTPEEVKQREIAQTVAALQNEVVPYLSNKFKNVADLATHLKNRRQPNYEILCLAMVANKEIMPALELAWQKLCRYSERHDKILPTPFKLKFDAWIKDGAKMPDLAKAKELTFEEAEKRRIEIAALPRNKRPL